MRWARIIFSGTLILLIIAILTWLAHAPGRDAGPPQVQADTAPARVFRLGLIPERDIFQQRKAYRALGDYLSRALHTQVELVTNSTYRGVLQDFAQSRVDAAFLGSLVAVIAIDRHHGEVVLKSESPAGVNDYAGVVFVLEKSPVQTLSQLRGHTLGGVRTTYAGAVYPLYLLAREGMSDDHDAPRLRWSGTHDDLIREVVAGRIDAGSVKDLRLDAFEKRHPETKFRRLETSPRVPDNALVLRPGLDPAQKRALVETLLGMQHQADGRTVLAQMELGRFTPCAAREYKRLYEMIDTIGPQWRELGIEGPPPRRINGNGMGTTTRPEGKP